MLGDRHVLTIAEYVEHYHWERNHQWIENTLIEGAPATDSVGRIRRRPRLGGVLNYYEHAARSVGSTEHWDNTWSA